MCIHSSAAGLLGCFYLLAIVTPVVASLGAHLFENLFSTVWGAEVLGHAVTLCQAPSSPQGLGRARLAWNPRSCHHAMAVDVHGCVCGKDWGASFLSNHRCAVEVLLMVVKNSNLETTYMGSCNTFRQIVGTKSENDGPVEHSWCEMASNCSSM